MDDKPDLVDLLLGDLIDVLRPQPVVIVHVAKAVLVGAPGLSPGDLCVMPVPLEDRPALAGAVQVTVNDNLVESCGLDDEDAADPVPGYLAAVLGPDCAQERDRFQ